MSYVSQENRKKLINWIAFVWIQKSAPKKIYFSTDFIKTHLCASLGGGIGMCHQSQTWRYQGATVHEFTRIPMIFLILAFSLPIGSRFLNSLRRCFGFDIYSLILLDQWSCFWDLSPIKFCLLPYKLNFSHALLIMNSDSKITDVALERLENARFVRSFAMRFKQGEKERRW